MAEDEGFRPISADCLPWGSSGIKRSKESHDKDWHNRWKRACIDVCWNCITMNCCQHPCKKATAVLKQKGMIK